MLAVHSPAKTKSHLSGQKCELVHNSWECRFLLSLLEVSHRLVFTTTATHNTHTGPSSSFSSSLSLLLDLNAEDQVAGRKGSYLTPSSRTSAKHLASQSPFLQALNLAPA